MTKFLTRISCVFATFALIFSLTGFSGQSGDSSQKTFTGEVTDTFCAPSRSHAGMMAKMPNMGRDAASCTRECATIGAKYVLLDDETGKTYEVEDQAKIAESAGRRVRVTGTLTANRMKVTSVSAIS